MPPEPEAPHGAAQTPPETIAPSALASLVQKGVRLPAPHLVAIARDVPLDAIAPGVVLHPFCRLSGARTRVDAGAVIGAGGPATLEDCWVGEKAVVGSLGPVTLRQSVLGPGTVLGCGVAERAVFLGKEGDQPDFTTGYGFRARRGTLYEEDANSAQHTDTKMTILFPWVTLGSNLNWCDVLVSGGTGPGLGEFSEIGSGAIHFNFTPRGDKATGSLLGDVSAGVFLRQPRVFLGGNASLIGPLRAGFGAVAAAGGRFTGVLHPGLNAGDPPPDAAAAVDYDLEAYGSVRRVVLSQVACVAELAALDAWYGHVREALAAGRPMRSALYGRARAVVRLNLRERIEQLGALAGRMERSVALLARRRPSDPRIAQQRALLEHWPHIEAHLADYAAAQREPPPLLLEALAAADAAQGGVYTRVIRHLPAPAVRAGQRWLREIVRRVDARKVAAMLPKLPGER